MLCGVDEIMAFDEEMRRICLAQADLKTFQLEHACPECEPARFDGALARVPAAQFCVAHARGTLARMYAVLGLNHPGLSIPVNFEG